MKRLNIGHLRYPDKLPKRVPDKIIKHRPCLATQEMIANVKMMFCACTVV